MILLRASDLWEKIRNAYFKTCRYWEIMRLCDWQNMQNDLKILHPLEPGQSRKNSFNIPKRHKLLAIEISCNFHDLRSQKPPFNQPLKAAEKAPPKTRGSSFSRALSMGQQLRQNTGHFRAVNSTGPQQRKTIRWSKKNNA